MGIDLNSSKYTIKDRRGQTKFSTDFRMPHILYDVPGTISVPKILALDPVADYVERTEETILITNELINNSNYFLMPYYRINGGPSETAASVICGGGTVVLRIIRQPSTGEFLGSSLLTAIVESNTIKLVVKHTLDRRSLIGSRNITGDDIINVGYRIYYGRFE